MDAVLSIGNLNNFPTKANITASLDLGQLAQMFPVEGIDMRGVFSLNANAEGTYDSTMNTMPVLSAEMALDKGYIKSADFPIPPIDREDEILKHLMVQIFTHQDRIIFIAPQQDLLGLLGDDH